MKGDARRPYVRKSRSASPHRSSSKSWLSRRLKRLKTRDTVILAGFLAAFLFGLVKTFFFWRAVRWEHMKPFRYVEYHQAELALPQHDLHNAFSNGKKYFWVNNHVSGEYDSLGVLYRSRVQRVHRAWVGKLPRRSHYERAGRV